MKGPTTQQDRVARARPQAAVSLQRRDDPAWAFCRANWHRDEGVLDLVRIALQDYRFRYPQCPASDTWLFYDGKRTTRMIGTPERVDVYCLFCRVLLVHPAIWQWDYTDQLRPHTSLCALRSLAGQLEPGAPHTYRLPESLQ